MNTLLIKTGHLAAVAMFAAKKDSRAAINGVCIDTGETGAFLVATCGHTLAVHQIDAVARTEGQFIMPTDAIAAMVKVNRKSDIKLTLPENFIGKYTECTHRTVLLGVGKGMSCITETDAIYPDWRRVARFDETLPTQPVFFNPEYLMRVDKAANLIRCLAHSVCVRPSKTGAGFAQLASDGLTVAYIMPLALTVDDLPSKPKMSYSLETL